MVDAWEVWAAFPLEGAEPRLIEWSFREDDAQRVANNLENMGMIVFPLVKTKKDMEG